MNQLQPAGGIVADIETAAKEAEEENKAARDVLRETAKWITGGIAFAAGGVIAGTSLSSLGSLGLEWRLLFAFLAALAGFCGLAFLLWLAVDIMAPKRHTLRTIAEGKAFPAWEMREIEPTIKDLLIGGDTLLAFCARYEKDIGATSKLTDDEKRSLVHLHRVILSKVLSRHLEIQFRRLRIRAFAVTPIVAFAFGAFAWAANPAKDDFARISPFGWSVDVDQRDLAFLRKTLTAPSCAGASLDVIVIGERRSGAQEVVTVPKGECLPVRLSIDHGRISTGR